ncbi:MAG: transcriptional repressor [Candidatus Thorarchaeota archaeon]|nr:transcriptional repressor [Candidatus Thorarchaeota archaeon]
MKRLKDHGLRMTPQRAAILEILQRRGKSHPSFSEICEIVKAKHPSVSQSTVLNNLTTFEKLGIVRSFSFRGETHYEMNPTPHVNFVDTKGRIIDIDDEKVSQILHDLIRTVRERKGIEADNLLVIFESQKAHGK